MSGSPNTVWARALTDELARLGVRDVVVAPGSRSTALVLAFAKDARFRVRVHLDERSAAFFALGVGRRSRRPAAVVTTSGTAAANLLPAVVEAWASAIPLVLLTADRPARLRGADANQAIDQVHLYGRYARAFHELPFPSADDAALRHLRTVVDRAVATAVGPTAGPVHLNVPFDKPFEPEETGDAEPGSAARGRIDGAPWVSITTGRATVTEAESDAATAAVDPTRAVVVAGPVSEPERIGPAVLAFAARIGAPLLADPLSGARFGPCAGAGRVAGYDLFLGDEALAARLAPSLVVRVGRAPTSAPLQRWLDRHDDAPQIVVDAESPWKDHAGLASRYLAADPTTALPALAERLAAAVERAGADRVEAWRATWRRADAAVRGVLVDRAAAVAASGAGAAEGGASGAHEGDAAAAVVRALPDGAALFVSSSMPIRDVDAYGLPYDRAVTVLGNRGASGIDGIVSSAFGVASRHEGPTVCLIGDVALFHDQNGLLWHREGDANVVFVLVDNDGGGIFHMLPVAEHEPHFTSYFATPHGLDFAHAAALHGIELRDVEVGDVEDAVRDATARGGTTILRYRSDREENRARHAETREAVVAAVENALGGTS